MSVEIKEAYSKQQTLEANISTWYDPTIDINLLREPKRFVHIYTVSKRDFFIQRPPLFPGLKVPACAASDRYRKVASIPDPFNQAVQDVNNGRMVGTAHDGLRVAIDLVNPNNITTNFDWEVPVEALNLIATGHGCDLSQQGVFISLSDPPQEIQITKAEAKRRKYYEFLRTTIDQQTEKDALTLVAGNIDFHLMADFFGLTYPWHKVMTAFVTCANCQERVPEGAAFHKLGDSICVLDWKKAVSAGIKKKEDVPEDHIWWDSKPSGQRRGA